MVKVHYEKKNKKQKKKKNKERRGERSDGMRVHHGED